MVTRCSLKTVASYSPVRLMYEKNNKSKQFIDSAPYSRVRLMVRKIQYRYFIMIEFNFFRF